MRAGTTATTLGQRAGAGAPSFLGIPGEFAGRVYSANEFLTRVNLMGGDQFPYLDTPISLGRSVVVIGPGMETVAGLVAPHPTVIQHERLGTGHAVAQARAALAGFDGDVLVVYGDTPLLTRATLERLLAVRRAAPRPAVVVLG